jgi:fluoride exporter
VSGRSLAAVGMGGGIGATVRFELELHLAHPTPPGFPGVTLVINIAGAFLLGALMALTLEHWPPTRFVRPFAAIGILGGFTTFSTFVVENDRLVGAHLPSVAITYVATSLVGGFVAVGLGALAADRLWPAITGRARQGSTG